MILTGNLKGNDVLTRMVFHVRWFVLEPCPTTQWALGMCSLCIARSIYGQQCTQHEIRLLTRNQMRDQQ